MSLSTFSAVVATGRGSFCLTIAEEKERGLCLGPYVPAWPQCGRAKKKKKALGVSDSKNWLSDDISGPSLGKKRAHDPEG